MTRTLAFLLGLLSCTVNVQAAEAAASKRPLSTQSCPLLFGTRQIHTRNRAFRERFVRWARLDPFGITVAHSHGRWEDVTALRLTGLSLERRGGDLLVRVSQDLATRLDCATGRYLLERDDSLGRGTRALALLGDVVLVAHRGKLAYISVPGAPDPEWLLAWQLRGVTVRRTAAARAAPRKPPPRRKPPRPRPAPRKR